MHIACRSPIWASGRGADILTSVYLTLILVYRNLANSNHSKSLATVDAFGMITIMLGLSYDKLSFDIIRREASALLYSTVMGNARASIDG